MLKAEVHKIRALGSLGDCGSYYLRELASCLLSYARNFEAVLGF
jgi:hypothetical protein